VKRNETEVPKIKLFKRHVPNMSLTLIFMRNYLRDYRFYYNYFTNSQNNLYFQKMFVMSQSTLCFSKGGSKFHVNWRISLK
jgi:hypothetical protein